MRAHVLGSLRAELRRAIRIVSKRQDGFRKRRRIGRWNPETRAIGIDGLQHASNGGRDDRNSHRHGFHQRKPEPLFDRRLNIDIETGHERLPVRAVTEEMNAVGKAEAFDLGPANSLFRAGAEQHELRVGPLGTDAKHRRKEVRMALPDVERRRATDRQTGWYAELRETPPTFDVIERGKLLPLHTVLDDGYTIGCDTFPLDELRLRRFADSDDSIATARGPRIEEGPPTSKAGDVIAVMTRLHDEPRRIDHRDESRRYRRVRKMRVQNVGTKIGEEGA